MGGQSDVQHKEKNIDVMPDIASILMNMAAEL
jgi:hypothetical protein